MTTAVLRPSPGKTTATWPKTVILSSVWALVLFVVALWVHAGGTTDTIFSSLGRLSGLLASLALLIQIIMMARIPVIERELGHDTLTLYHRFLGFSSFFLMLVHIAAVIMDQSPSLEATWSMITTWDGMLLAAAGTLALFAVVRTSFQAARRSMRYENWHLIHLYAYLGAGLALPHQLWTGTDFTANTWATVFWWTLWIAALVSVIVFRLGRPLVISRRAGLRVHAVRVDGNLVTVTMRGNVAALKAKGGQYSVFRFLGPGVTRGVPLSFSAAPTGSELEVTAAMVGPKTRRLAALTPGTRVLTEGAMGRMHSGVITQPHVVLMAAGTGVMPMIALLETLPAGLDVTVVLRAHDGFTAPGRQRLEELGARLFILEGPHKHGSFQPASSRLTDAQAMEYFTPNLAATDVFICGPTPWMKAAERAAHGARIHSERFGI